MKWRQSNLTLAKDDSNRFLPWLIAFMALLAALSISGMLMLKQISYVFEHSGQNTMTIQIPAGENAEADRKNISKAMEILRNTPGILESKKISDTEISKLLHPWLGDITNLKELPLPKFIDIEVSPNADLTVKKLVQTLTPILPGTIIDDHSIWLENIKHTLQLSKLVAVGIVILIVLVTIGTVVFTTRTGMGIHKNTIEVLHFVGARDDFIARQFAARAFIVGLQGGFIGILLATPILYLLDYVLRNMKGGWLPEASLNVSIWISISLIIPIVALIAMMTAHSTVLKILKKLL